MSRTHVAERLSVRVRYPALGNIEVIQLPKGVDARAVLARYRASGLVEMAQLDHWFEPAAAPNDPYYVNGTQWSLNNLGQSGGVADADIDAPEGWETLCYATNIIVAVIDSGARSTHEDLAANLWTNTGEIPGNGLDDDSNGIIDDVHGLNSIANSGDPFDDLGHGTHVAGIVGAVGNNGRGVSGVCWGVQLMICKFLNPDGGSDSDLIQCLDYARANGAKILNCSFVTSEFLPVLSNAFWNIRNAGILVVAAAGNTGNNNDIAPQYPAGFKIDNILAVTATTRADGFAGLNYGATSVHLAAPGSQIYSTYNGHDADYGNLSGTSMSAPYVAGAAALLMSRFPSAGYHEIRDRLLASVDVLPSLAGRCSTGGRLNLRTALGPPLVADFTPSVSKGLLPLAVTFTNSSFGTITNQVWDFGDGSPVSMALNPAHVFTNLGDYIVTLTVSGANGDTSTTNRTIRVVGDYQPQAAAFDWVPTNGMASLALGGNGVSGPQSLPFLFRLYGQDYGQIFVSADGLLGFTNSGLGAGANADLPDSAVPDAMLCPFWDDLNPAGGGNLWMGELGAAPNRKVVVSWVDVPHAVTAGGVTRFTFQAIMHESQHVAFQYLEVESGRNSLVFGRSATIGLEDATGSIAAKYSFNGSPSLVTNRQALLFVPPGVEGISPSIMEPVLGAGQVRFTIFASPMQSCLVQVSPNLTSWQTVATNIIPASGMSSFSDSLITEEPQRFYRALIGQ